LVSHQFFIIFTIINTGVVGGFWLVEDREVGNKVPVILSAIYNSARQRLFVF
jgi:hypothetical protein